MRRLIVPCLEQQEIETNQVCTEKGQDEQIMCSHSKTLRGYQKEWGTALYSDMETKYIRWEKKMQNMYSVLPWCI